MWFAHLRGFISFGGFDFYTPSDGIRVYFKWGAPPGPMKFQPTRGMWVRLNIPWMVPVKIICDGAVLEVPSLQLGRGRLANGDIEMHQILSHHRSTTIKSCRSNCF